MEVFVSEKLWTLLLISLTFSIFLMAFIQKLKAVGMVKKKYQLFIVNLIMSFLLGIPFGMYLYNLSLMDSVMMSLFGFIGAPSIYDVLKSQNILTYKPKSMTNSDVSNNNEVVINKENEIKRN